MNQSTGTERKSANFRTRLVVTGVIAICLLLVLLGRLYSLQVVQGPKLYSLARSTTTKNVLTPAPRGLICERTGCALSNSVLAGDVSDNVVTINRDQITNWLDAIANHLKSSVPPVISRLSALLNVTTATIESDLVSEDAQYSQYSSLPVAGITPSLPAVTTETLAYLAQNSSSFPGVKITATYERDYPQGNIASQVIGYTGAITASQYQSVQKDAKANYQQTDQYGQSGLEAEYESVLHGEPGNQEVEVGPSGNVVSTVKSTPAVGGDDVILNMDSGLESAAASDLANQITALRSGGVAGGAVPAPSGAVVVIDNHTGDVLAMSSFPSYNDNLWVGGITESSYKQLENEEGSPLNDYAVSSPQPPGSTFKLATATAALNDGLITPETPFDDTGSYTIPGSTQVLTDSDGEVLGELNVSLALAESSDIFFYNLGANFWLNWQNTKDYPYGETPIQNEAEKYGFGENSGLDLPSADLDPGQVDTPVLRKILHHDAPSVYPDTWTIGDNVEMAFGQGYTEVTPLQLADAYATFANHGVRYAPQLAAGIVSPSGKVIKKMSPKIMSKVTYASSADYNAILSGFEGTVQNPLGTAYAPFEGFNFTKWNIAGKTGTATGPTAQPTSWFVAFGGPRGESPEYTVVVQIDQGGFGAEASAPVARQIFNYLYSHPIAPVQLRS